MIVYNKKKHKWLLYTHDGSRVLGTHETYDQALRQERAIQWAKHRRGNPKERPSRGYCIRRLNQLMSGYRDLTAKQRLDTFVFVHFVQTEAAFRSIQESGFLGRPVDRVAAHKMGLSPEALVSDGYIFGYRLPGESVHEGIESLEAEFEEYMDALMEDGDLIDEPPRVIILSRAVFGLAYAGVEVYRDNEHQMVIPIDCIDTQSLVFEKFDDSVFPFFEDA